MKLLILLLSISLISCSDNNERSRANIQDSISRLPTLIIHPEENGNVIIKNVNSGCAFTNRFQRDSLALYKPQLRELNQIKNIVSYIGLPLNFEVYAAHINNAVATVVSDKRIILYDPTLLREVDQSSNTYWTSMSILAHEIGHHLSGHLFLGNNNHHKSELEADKFSGSVLYKMGATLEQSILAMSL